MKNFSYYLFVFLCASACTLPSYKDVNPKPLKDAPAFGVVPSPTSSKSVKGVTYIKYGQPTDFSIEIVDAPGKIADVTSAISIPSYGTSTTDQNTLGAIMGSEKGSTKVTFTPGTFTDATDRNATFDVSVSDSQVDEHGLAAGKTTKVATNITLVKCLDEGVAAGIYRVTAASGNLDGGGAYDLSVLEADNGGPITLTISKTRPGLYLIDEVTGGVWPIYYSGRANPALSLDLCSSSLTGHDGLVTTGLGTTAQRKFSIAGTLNSNGTISITWSYLKDAGTATPANPAKGTYTLTKS